MSTTRSSMGNSPGTPPLPPPPPPPPPPSSLSHMLSTMVTSPAEYSVLYYYKSNPTRFYLFLLASILSFGIFPLVCMWFPQYYTYCTKQPVASIESEADYVLVKVETPNQTLYEECQLYSLEHSNIKGRYFIFRKSRYIYDSKKQIFLRIQNQLSDTYGECIQRTKNGLSSLQSSLYRTIYGANEIDLTPQRWNKVLFRKIIHPFYLFQVLSAFIWLGEAYTTYALIILFMSALSIVWEVSTQVKNDLKLHELVQNHSQIQVVRESRVESVPVSNLVVGDVVLIQEGIVSADLLLVSGECTADESTLTGEAIPISKHAIPPFPSPDTRLDLTSLELKNKESILYNGSSILYTQPDTTRGIVLATGFSTAKGELFRSILYPTQIRFKMESDSYRFMLILSCIAFLAFIKRMIQASQSPVVTSTEAFLSALDLVTIAVPPALPLVLTIGIGFALVRLEKNQIFCINSQRINISGHINCFCFDKTGTLSSDHLDFQGVDESSSTTSTFMGLQNEVEVLSVQALVGLATCHGLTETQGHITGYSLEQAMFKATGYSLERNLHKRTTPSAPFSILISSPIGKTFGIVKRYFFNASLQRSSVLIEDFESGQRLVYTKGSPESIQSICTPGSLPQNYLEKARNYAYQGYYVIALASKSYPVTADVPLREAMECRLQFIGFILFLNKIKTESPYVINTLEESNIDVRVITGDNAFTAIHVSRKLNMVLHPTIWLLDMEKSNSNKTKQLVYADVDELATQTTPQWTIVDPKTFLSSIENHTLAMTGSALEQVVEMNLSSTFIDQLILQTKIFSRIKPQQKTFIIEVLIRNHKIVGMVGDGTNDCGALKAAHVGIALSDADASIVAPFTSRQKLITDVIDLLREGRCALSTSFVAFKYMVLYSIIQLTMCSFMNDNHSQMSNNQYLFDDLIVVFGLSMLMVRTKASERLTREMPPATLFAPSILLSLGGQILIMLMCLGIALSSMKTKDWYCSASHAYELSQNASTIIESPCYYFEPGSPADLTQHSYENSVIWLFGHLQYWIVALVFNIQDIFRLSFVSNKYFTIYVGILFLILQIQLFSYKSEYVAINTNLGIVQIPASFCTSLFFLFLFDFFLAVVWEKWMVQWIIYRFEVRQTSGSWFGRTIPSAYVADRDLLLGKQIVAVDDGEDEEEEDVLNKPTDAVYVSYDSS